MPNKPLHSFVGKIGGIFLGFAMAFYYYELIGIFSSSIGGLIGFLSFYFGSLFPDVDHHNSHINTLVKKLLIVLTSIYVVMLEWTNQKIVKGASTFMVKNIKFIDISAEIMSILLSASLVAVAVRAVLYLIKFSVHGGRFHSYRWNIILTAVMIPPYYLIFLGLPGTGFQEAYTFTMIQAFSWMMGIVWHLTLDQVINKMTYITF